MATIIIFSAAAVPAGATYNQFTGLTFAPSSTLTKAAGVFDSTFGRYALRTANGINGGTPNQGELVFTIRALAAIVPTGAANQFTGLTFSPSSTLTKIAGINHSLLGSYDGRLKASGILGAATPPLFGSGPLMVFVNG